MEHPLKWILIGGTVLLLGLGIGVGSSLFPRKSLFNRGPAAPQPTASEAAQITVPPEGLLLTIKQRSSAYLPGGKAKLHLDDITSRQVLMSATEGESHVIWGPTSIKKGDIHTLTLAGDTFHIEVVRLKNTLASDDFAEFRIKRQ